MLTRALFKTQSEKTPLFLAVERGAEEMVFALLSYGATMSVRNRNGMSVCDIAKTYKRGTILNRLEQVKLLLVLCSSINVPRLSRGDNPVRLLTKDILRSLTVMLFSIADCLSHV